MVTESEDATIPWNMQIHIDCEIAANKPDIVIKDHKTMTCKLINIVVPSDRNTSVKVIEKLVKYKDLEIETTRMWGMSTETVWAVIGALGVIKKGLEEQTGKILGSINISGVTEDNAACYCPYFEKDSIHKMNSLVPKDHGLNPALVKL